VERKVFQAVDVLWPRIRCTVLILQVGWLTGVQRSRSICCDSIMWKLCGFARREGFLRLDVLKRTRMFSGVPFKLEEDDRTSNITVGWSDPKHGTVECLLRGGTRFNVKSPKKIIFVEDSKELKPDKAFNLVNHGTAIVWTGDFHKAKAFLKGILKRVKNRKPPKDAEPLEQFRFGRMNKATLANFKSKVLLHVGRDHTFSNARAPTEVQEACRMAFGETSDPYLIGFNDVLSLVGSLEHRKKGIYVDGLDLSIYPHYGVFPPTRHEYISLLDKVEFDYTSVEVAYDVGTGTGIIGAALLKKGVQHVIATDLFARALNCAHDNFSRLGLLPKTTLVKCDLFPESGKHKLANLIVFNPPWFPAKPDSAFHASIYDSKTSRNLKFFLKGAPAHLAPNGQVFLIVSDLPMKLGLRSADEIDKLIISAGMEVLEKVSVLPSHSRTGDSNDELNAFRKSENVELWRLRPMETK